MVKIHFNGPVSVNGPLVVNGVQYVTVTDEEKDGDEKDASQDDDTESEGVHRIRIGGAVIGGRRIVH